MSYSRPSSFLSYCFCSYCLVSGLQSPLFTNLSKCSSINPSKFALSQGSGVPKGINKSCQGFWPLWLLTMKIISPGSQSWLPSSLWQIDKYIFCALMSAWGGVLALLDPHPVLSVLTVCWPFAGQHSPSVGSLTERRSHAWSSVRRSDFGWRKSASPPPPPLLLPHATQKVNVQSSAVY